MKRILSFSSIVVVLFWLLALPAFAQNEQVLDVHVNNMVAIPGSVLRPGNYTFRLLDSATGQGLVLVQSANGKRSYGMIPVFSTSRREDGGSIVTTKQPEIAGVARIDSWYFPGSTAGYHFIYSKSDMQKLNTIAQKMHATTTAGM